MRAGFSVAECKQFACVLWIDEQQYSVVPATDIMGGDVKEGDEATVVWRVVKKKKIHSSWFKAKMLNYSETEDDLHLLCDRYAEEKENNALKEPRRKKKTAKGQALIEDTGNKLDNEESLSVSVSKAPKPKSGNDQPSSGLPAPKKPAKKNDSGSVKRNKSSLNAANVEAAQRTAKTFFKSLAAKSPVADVDLCSDTDDASSTDSEPQSNRRVVPKTPDLSLTPLYSKANSHAFGAKSPVADVDPFYDTIDGTNADKEPHSNHVRRAVPQTPDSNLTLLHRKTNSLAFATPFSQATQQNTISPKSRPLPSANNSHPSHGSSEVNSLQSKPSSQAPRTSQSTAAPQIAIPKVTAPSTINKDVTSPPAPTNIISPGFSSSPLASSTWHAPKQLYFNHEPILSESKNSTTDPAQMESYMDFLCSDEETHTDALSGVLGGAIRHSYNVQQEPQRSENVEPGEAKPYLCSNCALYKTRSEELQAELKELQQRCGIFLSAPVQVVGYLQQLTEFLSTQNQEDENTLHPMVKVGTDTAFGHKTSPSGNTPLQKSHFEGGVGRQELCPSSGVLIQITKLKAIHHKAGYDLHVIFHELVEHFFTEKELSSSVAFGTRSVPDNKEVLSPTIVSAIQAYLLACAQSLKVRPLEPGKICKMFTNKCTAAKAREANNF